jgi:hypothetical protein
MHLFPIASRVNIGATGQLVLGVIMILLTIAFGGIALWRYANAMLNEEQDDPTTNAFIDAFLKILSSGGQALLIGAMIWCGYFANQIFRSLR